MRNPDQVLSRYQLLEGAWDNEYEHRSNVIDVYVGYLREKLDRPFGTQASRPFAASAIACAADDLPPRYACTAQAVGERSPVSRRHGRVADGRQPCPHLEIRARLVELAHERVAAEHAGLVGNRAYMEDLEDEIAAYRVALAGLAVTEIAVLRGELFGRQFGWTPQRPAAEPAARRCDRPRHGGLSCGKRWSLAPAGRRDRRAGSAAPPGRRAGRRAPELRRGIRPTASVASHGAIAHHASDVGVASQVLVSREHVATPTGLVQDRASRALPGIARERQERAPVHALPGRACAASRIVGARSTFPTSSWETACPGMPGPRSSSGTLVEGSYGSIFPLGTSCSPCM